MGTPTARAARRGSRGRPGRHVATVVIDDSIFFEKMGDGVANDVDHASAILYVILPVYLGGALVCALCGLLWPVLWPECELIDDAAEGVSAAAPAPLKKKGAVVLAGSYNPPHKGHIAMLAHLSRRYDKIYAVVGYHPGKVYAVTADQRCEVLTTMTAHLGNVEPVAVEGYIWRWAFASDVTGVYRGIRSWHQDGMAERWLELQNRVGPMVLGPLWPYQTTFLCLPAPGEDGGSKGGPNSNLNVSSTEVRDRLRRGEYIDDLVGSAKAAKQIAALWTEKKGK